MEAQPMEVDVIVPVLNGGERFGACLASLKGQRGVRARIIAVDNGSTDGTQDVARDAGVLLLTEPRRTSYAARNRGLAAATAPVVVFTDADCIADPDWLRNGLDAMTANGWDLCAGAIHQERATTWSGRYDELTYVSQEQHVTGFGFGATGNLFVRRAVVDEVGPFIGSLRSGGDLEFCRRAIAAGKTLGFARDAIVSHPPRESLRDILRKSWRIGTGHAEVGSYHPSVLRWGLSPKRLLPDRQVVRAHWRRPTIVAVDVLARWVAWSARVTAVVSSRRTEAVPTS